MAEQNRPDSNQGPGGPDPDRDSRGGPGKQPNGPMLSRTAFGWIMLGVLAMLLLILLMQGTDQADEVSWTEFLNIAEAGHFEDEVVVESDRVVGDVLDDAPGYPSEGPRRRFASIHDPDSARKDLEAVGQPVTMDPAVSIWLPLLLNWGPVILIMFLIYFFVIRSLRGAGGGPGMLGSFGRSRHRVMNKEHSTVTLSDVAGIDEAKDEVSEIVEFLKNPKKFQRLGGRVPRGVLLIGDPGCGKTLLAKAVAGEADVPFFSISGSDFVEMFVGVGASRVRDLFKQAKDSAPCIIFLDEIDAVGRRRGSGFSSGGHDEREQTLNAILVEMDGFESNDQVIVVAATNRSDVLDPALTRPGRFDRQIQVPLPDLAGRLEILTVHGRKVKTGPDVNFERLARGTPMFSGADLAAIINEAAISATLQNKDFVEQDDLEEARDKVRWGRAVRSRRVEDDERRVTAVHEAGHAVVTYLDEHAEPLHKVTIIPRGQALGATFSFPDRDRYNHTKKQLLAQLRVLFGGRLAEDIFLGDVSTGAASDIKQATRIARAMVMRLGMSEKLGFQEFGADDSRSYWEQTDRSYSDETAAAIDAEVKHFIDSCYAEARDMIESHREQMEHLTDALLRYETLTADEVDRIMKGEKLDKPTVADLLAAEKHKGEQGQGATIQPGGTDLADDAPPGALPSPA